MTTVSVRLPDPLAKKLAGVAKEAERSKSFIVQKAIESYLEEYADLQIALDRLRDSAASYSAAKQLRKVLAL
jgi:RHH-type rel operon transcriptional repressor/antitoxin RelB